MAGFKGIIFAKGYNRSFAEFKNEFASTHVFKAIPKSKREAALKKAYKVATTDGNIPTSNKKSGKPKSGKGKQ